MEEFLLVVGNTDTKKIRFKSKDTDLDVTNFIPTIEEMLGSWVFVGTSQPIFTAPLE